MFVRAEQTYRYAAGVITKGVTMSADHVLSWAGLLSAVLFLTLIVVIA
ncbi:hypothetical protein GIW81_15810 [Hyphomicrobium sp. xq]|uniref:Uncharacterized protein n=1 Tax=Hyphomicrobium album TaxID=2665159 RepID=A0A6I3KJA6_9HYPH|nr:hypothetical protein [Hyphomicrobium album]MTD95805.1 hypothetical protein [Hyphomicrobium album]